MTLAATRTMIAGLLADVPDLEVNEKAPGQVTTPAAIIGFDQAIVPAVGGTAIDLQAHVRLLVQWGDNDDAQDQLDALLEVDGEGSAVAALLGATGAVGQLTWDSYGLIEYNAVEYLGATIHFEVYD